jgi:type IV secretion/conjugal transfer VirB4 family ATPase
MVSLKRILKDHLEAGSVNGLLALWGFIDDSAFLTKAGAIGVVYRLHGPDDECLDHDERRAVTQRFEQALRQLTESFRIYQYLIKRQAQPIPATSHAHPVVREALERRSAYFAAKADALFELDAYLVVLFEGWAPRPSLAARLASLVRSPRTAWRELFSATAMAAAIEARLTRAGTHLHQRAQAFAAQLADTLHPVPLPKAEAFRFFRRLLNYTPYKADHAALTHDSHLDFSVSDSSIDCHRDHLEIGGYGVKVLTMKEPPAKTFAHMLHDLYRVPSTFIACLEWQRRPNASMRGDLRARMRHFFNMRISMINYFSPQTRPEDMLVDTSATATVTELGQGLTEMEVHGRFFGACSLSLVVYDRDAHRLDESVADCVKAFAGHDGALFEESYNLINAWLAVVPGNAALNLRRLPLLNTNYADLSFLFTPHTGQRTSAHLGGRDCLAVFETDHQTPYFWNLHVDDVGHALVLGATGSGKSFLLNFLITHAQQYDPFTVIFDLGRSYHTLTTRLGGSLWRMGLEHRTFTINPFCLPSTDENLHFLVSFVRVLMQSDGQYRLNALDGRELEDAVKSLYALDPPQRRLLTLASTLPRPLAQHLYRWVQGGPYADLFDHADDTLTFQRLQCFDFQGLDKYQLLLEPLLFYVLHRASASIGDVGASSQLKLFVLDEAWRFVQDGTLKNYITEALKTWRKQNAAMLLATQSSEDFGAGDLLRTVVESCPTKFFLANHNLDLARARSLFHLNHTEADLITKLIPKQQVLMKRPDLSKVLNLHVDPTSCAIYTPAPSDPQRRPAPR